MAPDFAVNDYTHVKKKPLSQTRTSAAVHMSDFWSLLCPYSEIKPCVTPPTYADASYDMYACDRPARPLPTIPKSRPSFLHLDDTSPLSPKSSPFLFSPVHYSDLSPARSSSLPPAYSPQVRDSIGEKAVFLEAGNNDAQAVSLQPLPPPPELSLSPHRSERFWLPPAPAVAPPPPPSAPAISIVPPSWPTPGPISAHSRSLSLPTVQVCVESQQLHHVSIFSPLSPASALSVECIAPSSPIAQTGVSPVDHARPSSFLPPPIIPPMVLATQRAKSLASHSSPPRSARHTPSNSLETLRDWTADNVHPIPRNPLLTAATHDILRSRPAARHAHSDSSVSVRIYSESDDDQHVGWRPQVPAHLLPRTPPCINSSSSPQIRNLWQSTATPDAAPRRARTPCMERTAPQPALRRAPSTPFFNSFHNDPPASAPVPVLTFPRHNFQDCDEWSLLNERGRSQGRRDVRDESDSAAPWVGRMSRPAACQQPPQTAPCHVRASARDAARPYTPELPQSAGILLQFTEKPILGSFRVRGRARMLNNRSVSRGS
ncbi:hypothetical protein K488DRAFT_85351 [Vararia minispora EC-137]|uniref:Uncharacterized protein n=1 Tax=Vararia minispora EC-137 TaxID=1314806 RepID=A0ACB8QMT5_9AGAM|nr:hypothetical protein K488DRAFT_85351 [Vararia minispora EC-137]